MTAVSARDLAIRDAYAAGASLRTIGARHDLSHEAVRKVLRRLGIAQRRRVRATAPVRLMPSASRSAVIALARAWPGLAEGAP